MRILYINHYAGSPRHGMEYRPYYLAREWVRAGHQVTIAAATYSHVRARQPQTPPPGTGPVHEELIDAVLYRWYRTPDYRGNGVGRVKNMLSFLARLWLDSRWLAGQRPDVVIASSTYPMDIWVARRIARMARAKLVFEVHDLWPLSPIELGGMSPRHPFIRLCQAAEDAAYRDADAVVSMLPKVAAHMSAHGLNLSKLCIIPNGIAPEEWDGAHQPLGEPLASHLRRCRDAGRTIVGYAGSHGIPNALDVLLDVAHLVRNEPFEFVLVGDGHEKSALARRVARDGLVNVTMFDPIRKDQIPGLLGSIDIAYIGWQRVPIYRFGIAPNKLMDYMMAECVVLHAVEAGNDPVAEAGCGLTVPPDNTQAIVAALRQLNQLTPDERRAMGKLGRDFVLTQHAYPVLAQRFLQAVS